MTNDKILKMWYNNATRMVENAIKLTEDADMTNSQEFLNFLDELNKLTIKY